LRAASASGDREADAEITARQLVAALPQAHVRLSVPQRRADAVSTRPQRGPWARAS
jgi:hypothetical protein